MARKMYRDAIETYMQAPVSAQMLNKIGIAYHQLADIDTAGKYYQRAIKMDPEFADAINNLGTIYYSKKSYRRAINEFRKVLRVKPDAASTWANLANAYFERKQYERSTEALQKALELDPTVLDNRGTVGSLVQDRNVADRAKYHYYLAKSLAKQGKNSDRAPVHSQGSRRRLQGTKQVSGGAGIRGFARRSRVQTDHGHGA